MTPTSPSSREVSRLNSLLISSGTALLWITLCSLLLADNSPTAIIFFDINTELLPYPLTLQNLMWLVFFIGIGELYYRYQQVSESKQAIHSGYLSEDPTIFYTINDIVTIRQRIYRHNNLLAQLLNTLTIRYQASSKSVEQTHQMLNSQLELLQFRLDVDYNMIRYIIWLIPTLGFIGTVIGIALALNAAGIPGAAERPDFVSTLTAKLAVAFYTTLVALMMSTLLVYLMHLVQGAEERMIQRCGDYCLNHFINKLMS
ncbi:MAG: MotA/TolQ/ExbB proton channel family protein [Gammaproteobacteria bacterium]|nr:MotA/TolQ/ExbB proton channel family protein [Gammaproteobacteria bacterium]